MSDSEPKNQNPKLAAQNRKAQIPETVVTPEFSGLVGENMGRVKKTASISTENETRPISGHASAAIRPPASGSRNDLEGRQIGNILIEESIGSGGMGRVYQALDTQLERRVAVKTIRGAHRLSLDVKQRFRREALILSKLDHPGICRIHHLIEEEDADFLVLEYVDGETLLQAMVGGLAMARKLEIAADLLDALTAAHSEKIVHRDLKPENIMITAGGQVKILDFGISRTMESMSTQAEEAPTPHAQRGDFHESGSASYTVPGLLLGTVAYMSPEQASGEEVTTASDIFSLGLVLQELLSTSQAHPQGLTKQQLLNRAEAGETILVSGLAGDLAYLIERMKAPAPAARPTAVDAAGILTKIRQKPKRRLRQLLAASALMLVAVAGVKYTLDLDQARARAEVAREDAELARENAEQVADFLSNLFRLSDPSKSKGETITAQELLDRGAERIDTELADQPRILIRLKSNIGEIYRLLGLYDRSRVQYEGAIDIAERLSQTENKVFLEMLEGLAAVEFELGNYDTTQGLLERVISAADMSNRAQASIALQSKSDLSTLYRITGRIHKAKKLQLQVLASYRAEPEGRSKEIAVVHTLLGNIARDEGDVPAAVAYARESLRLIQESEIDDLLLVSTLQGNLANVLMDAGELQEASVFASRDVATKERILGAQHPELARAISSLAVLLYRSGELEAALVQNARALEIYQNTEGKQSRNHALTLANRAMLFRNAGRLPEAEKGLVEVIDTLTGLLGTQHQYVIEYRAALANIYFLQHRYAKALPLVRGALADFDANRSPIMGRVLKAWYLLASIQTALGEVDQTKTTYREIISRLENTQPPDEAEIAEATAKLSKLRTQ